MCVFLKTLSEDQNHFNTELGNWFRIWENSRVGDQMLLSCFRSFENDLCSFEHQCSLYVVKLKMTNILITGYNISFKQNETNRHDFEDCEGYVKVRSSKCKRHLIPQLMTSLIQSPLVNVINPNPNRLQV